MRKYAHCEYCGILNQRGQEKNIFNHFSSSGILSLNKTHIFISLLFR
jgi:hypothetical protein